MRNNRQLVSANSSHGVSASPSTSGLTACQSANLTGLEPATTYHYRVKSVDTNGNQAVSSDQTFTTTSGDTIGQLGVHFMGGGNGDAIFITHVTNRGTNNMLIDCGDGSSDIVNSYLKNHVDDGEIGTVVTTHPHKDHIGGLNAVLEDFKVRHIWHNGDALSTETYASFQNAVQLADAEVHEASQGDEITVGDLRFRVLNPRDVSATTNNNSIVLALSYDQVDFLFEGDAEQEAEARMLDAGLISPFDVLKNGHHGSKSASSKAFLEAVIPKIAICTVGTGNIYGHPHAETISALHSVGAETYRTDVHGTVIVTTDGRTYTVSTSKRATAVMSLERRDTTGPLITHIAVSHITSDTATITWTSDRAATSQVEYGLTASYGSSSQVNSPLLTSDGIGLSDSPLGCTYHFRV
jgi:beta-lactamase superfamily II metal-dependent hydrolase